MRRLAWVLLSLATFLLWLWLIPSIWFSNLPTQGLRLTAAAVFAIAPWLALAALPNRKRSLLWTSAACVVVFGWWLAIPASNDREWAPEYERMASAEIEGNRLTIHDVRNFDYRSETDFTPRYYDASYDLDELQTLDFVKVHWDGLVNIAHTMLSFGFEDGRYLAVSVETRREKHEVWSSVRGFFKQYELIYILADERDLLRLRTNFRGEDVYLYPTNTPREGIRFLLLDILERVNGLHEKPEFYNTISDNCTTSLATHIRKIRGRRRWDPRLLLNGHTDEMARETGWISSELPLDEMRKRHYVNRLVEDVEDPSDYSARIRAPGGGE